MKRVFLLGVLICMLGAMTTNAQENNSTAKSTSDGKPVVTTLMSKKLAYACRRYPQTMGMLLAQSTGAETPLALAWKLELMDEGAPEICEKLLWDIYNITEPLFQENLQSIGFSSYEISLSVKLVTYLKEKKDKLEKTLLEEGRKRLIAHEDSLFNAWSKNGVPDNISPTVHATIKCMDTISFVKYIDSLNLDTAINYSFYVGIDEHGIIKSAWSYGSNNSNPKYLEEIIYRLQLQAEPAKYTFNAISRSIDMGTREAIDIYEKREGIAATDFYHSDGIYLWVKYNRKKNRCKIASWSLGVVYLEEICKQEGIDESSVLQEIASCLEQTSYSGKLEINFDIYRRELFVKSRSCDIVARGKLRPKTVLKKVWVR